MKTICKKHLGMLFSVALVFSLYVPAFAAPNYQGSGTSDDPFLITSSDELMALSDFLLPPWSTEELVYYSRAYYKLADNIDMKGYNWQVPIGHSSTHIFLGDFNGNNKTISNLENLTMDTYAKGLFGWMGGSVYDLTLENVNLQSEPTGTTGGIGGVAGVLYSKYDGSTLISGGLIENVNVTGTITVGVQFGRNAGGIVGSVHGPNARISNCTFDGEIIGLATVNNYMGGIVGFINQPGLVVENCYSAGEIIRPGNDGGRYIGKIAGNPYDATFINDTTSMIINANNLGGPDAWNGYDGIEVDPVDLTKLGVYYNDAAVAVKNANKLAVATFWLTANGTPTFGAYGDFSVLDSALDNGVYRVTLGYMVAGGNGFSSADAAILSINGATGVELTRARFSGYDESGTAVDFDYFLDSAGGGSLPPVIVPINYDLNSDGVIDQLDLAIALKYFMVSSTDANWNEAKIADFNKDGRVDIEDYIKLLNNMAW